MSYSDVTPIIGLKDMPKGKPTGQMCALCNQPIFSGQLTTGCAVSTHSGVDENGARLTDEGYHEGHFACVLKALGGDEALKATHEGRLPMINPDELVDGCLPDGWQDWRWVDIGKEQLRAQGRTV